MADISHEEFILAALGPKSPFRRDKNGSLKVDKAGKPYKGVHTTYSGFNTAFRALFPGDDPVEATTQAHADGVIVSRPARGGATLYLPADAPESQAEAHLKALGVR